MSLMKPYKDLNPNLNKLASTYIGVVEDNNDPKHLQRIKVRIPSLFGTIPTENLPWAIRATDYSEGNTSGSFQIPDVGQYVEVMFDGDCIYNPVYRLGAISSALSEFVGTYLTSHGIQDKYGNVVKFSNQGIIIKDPNGNTVTLNSNGVTIDSSIKTTVNSNMAVNGNTTTTGNYTITGSVTATSLASTSAATGSFTSADSKTITVTKGIVTAIA